MVFTLWPSGVLLDSAFHQAGGFEGLGEINKNSLLGFGLFFLLFFYYIFGPEGMRGCVT